MSKTSTLRSDLLLYNKTKDSDTVADREKNGDMPHSTGCIDPSDVLFSGYSGVTNINTDDIK